MHQTVRFHILGQTFYKEHRGQNLYKSDRKHMETRPEHEIRGIKTKVNATEIWNVWGEVAEYYDPKRRNVGIEKDAVSQTKEKWFKWYRH